jgi:L-2-hydroxyglutarate oxidase
VRVAIIGGGIIGLAVAHKLLCKHPTTRLHLLEKESTVGEHQSGRNSGVLHCGLYYQPGSLKAQLAVDGIRQMTAFCEKHQVAHEVCGKVVIATTSAQEKTLNDLAKRGEKNGLSGLKFLSKGELALREPNVKAEAALLVPEEGIADYKAVMAKMSELIKAAGGKITTEIAINEAKQLSNGKTILLGNDFESEFDLVISCTGLYSDLNYTRLTGIKRPLHIVPFRGEYLLFKPEFEHVVNHLVYPVPDIQYPFLGVHFTRLIHGGREVGPNAVLALKREGYTTWDLSIPELWDTLSFRGFWRFLTNNFSFAFNEFQSSLRMDAFIDKAKQMIPDIDKHMFVKGTAGVRAQALSPKGELIMDFNVQRIGNQIHVLNAPSPGATASLAIADYILDNYIKN